MGPRIKWRKTNILLIVRVSQLQHLLKHESWQTDLWRVDVEFTFKCNPRFILYRAHL